MVDNSREPILDINEFEEEAESILKSAREEASGIVQEARNKAGELIRSEKLSFSLLEKENLERIDDEIRIEREKLMKKAGEALRHIESISSEKIKKAVDYIIAKVMPVRK